MLDRISYEKVGHSWWDAVSHNICMLSLMAPYAYASKQKTHYIATTFSAAKDYNHCSNYPVITEALKFTSCNILQADAQMSRIDKLNQIIKFSESHENIINLFVCWYPKNGGNCSNCEKCFRTIMGIVSKKGDPNKLGFKVNNNTFKRIKRYLEENHIGVYYWDEIRESFLKDRKHWEKVPKIKWFLDFRFNDTQRDNKYRFRRLLKRIKTKTVRVIKKIRG